jgi:hypothetical protein
MLLNIRHEYNNITVFSANSDPSHRISRAIIQSIKDSCSEYQRRKMIEEDKDVQRMIDNGKQLVSYKSTNDEFQL